MVALSTPVIELRYRTLWPIVWGLTGGLFTLQFFVPQLLGRGGFLEAIPVVGPYLNLVAGLSLIALGIGTRMRPVARVSLDGVERVRAVFGTVRRFDGPVRMVQGTLMAGETDPQIAKFLVEPADWDRMVAHIEGGHALD